MVIEVQLLPLEQSLGDRVPIFLMIAFKEMVPILKEHIPGIWNWQEAEGAYISGRGRTSNCEFSKVNALREKEIRANWKKPVWSSVKLRQTLRPSCSVRLCSPKRSCHGEEDPGVFAEGWYIFSLCLLIMQLEEKRTERINVLAEVNMSDYLNIDLDWS